jgi:nucleoside-diphosphate-sugar epimerase
MTNSSKNLIIGNGLIAKSLEKVDFGFPALILASGVSDSREVRPEAFARETNLVSKLLLENRHLDVIYFSTCSIDSGLETPYINHKLLMENIVMAIADSCHIFRLPQLVGLVHNRTLISNLVCSILSGQKLSIQMHATRNLLDIRDLARVTTLAVSKRAAVGRPQNIATSTQVLVTRIVEEVEKNLGCSARIEFLDEGYSQDIDVSFLRCLLEDGDPLFDPIYWKLVLKYYIPLIASISKK